MPQRARELFPAILAFALGAGCFTGGAEPIQQVAQPAPAASDGHTVQAAPSAANSIKLDVVVTDKSGAPVKGLKVEDFKVFDNKHDQAISVDERSGASATPQDPVEAYVVIDTINPHVSVVASERRDLTAWLQKMSELPLPTSLVFLTPDGLKIQGQPTRTPAILLGNLDNNPTSLRTFHDSGYYSSEALREKCLMAMNVLAVELAQRPGRKLVIWVSPGWAEFIMQSSQMSRKEQEQLFTYEASLSVALRVARMTLYAVDPMGAECVTCSRNSYYKNYLKGPRSAGDADQNDLLLQTLAAKTGGKVVTGKNNIPAMIEECMAEAQTYYEVKFDVPLTSPETTFHEIRVQVDRPGLKTRTSTGYFTLAPAALQSSR